MREKLRVILVSPRNPLNIGAAARAMSNFGFRALRIVNPYEVAFKEARSAVNASAVLEAAESPATLAEAVADCTLVVGTTSAGPRELKHSLRRLEYGARLIRRHLEGGGVVGLLFGSEKYGLSNEDLAHCHWLLRIPTREEHHSMNLGQSVAVILYELIRDARAARKTPEPVKAARGEQVERLTELLVEALETAGYMNPKTAGSTRQKVRRMVHRLSLPERDAELWQGMVRQMLWKMKKPSC
ncbi:MAG: TrmJ/YjtD family RNA methyltransferase [Bryobacteraceae bacterium]|nr:TrmJ/YjtD family RNA methyltransferase [Bryobacteraceae bacterium]